MSKVLEETRLIVETEFRTISDYDNFKKILTDAFYLIEAKGYQVEFIELNRYTLEKLKSIEFIEDPDVFKEKGTHIYDAVIIENVKCNTGDVVIISEVIKEYLGKQTFINILKELPSDEIIWKLMDGEQTAETVIKSLEESGELGKQYISDVFRVAKGMIERDIKRTKSKDS